MITINYGSNLQRFRTSHGADFKGSLSSVAPTELSVTNNNLKVASQDLGSETSTVGVWVDSGARYEDAKNNGAANLIERLIFKGSVKRAQADLESEIGKLKYFDLYKLI